MSTTADALRVLKHYPTAATTTQVEFLANAGGFSGSHLWRVSTLEGDFCLRRWPLQHPKRDRLEFIQAVLWHVGQEGFHLAATPVETLRHRGYVYYNGHYWELCRWLPGNADYHAQPSPVRLAAACVALAQFHRAAESFPLPETRPRPSPSLTERARRLEDLASGGSSDELRELAAACRAETQWPAIARFAGQFLRLAAVVASRIAGEVKLASVASTPLQPCIRDIWSDHVLFLGDQVTGIVDFGAMRPDESVAADVARLLGSLALDDAQGWRIGLGAYETVRPLSVAEREMVRAFDRSTTVLAGLNWLRWHSIDRRTFPDRAPIEARLDRLLGRLQRLASDVGGE
jgi:Ser/Thr protein kinase RdoA (MazF antagonist)